MTMSMSERLKDAGIEEPQLEVEIILEKILLSIEPDMSIDEFCMRPITCSFPFVAAARRRFGNNIPEDLPLRCLMNARKRGAERRRSGRPLFDRSD